MTDGGAVAAQEIEGRLEGLIEGVAVGWAWDRNDPNRMLVVEILADGYPVALGRADIFRGELRDIGVDAHHGFQIGLPNPALEHGRIITARLANQTDHLKGQALLNEVGDFEQDKLPRLRGEITQVTGLILRGWVHPEAFSLDPCRVQAVIDGELVAECAADELPPMRNDNERGSLLRMFTLRLPMRLADGTPYRVKICSHDGVELKGSPTSVIAWDNGITQVLRDAVSAIPDNPHLSKMLAVTANAVERHEKSAPVSVPFEDYPAWREVFQAPGQHHGNELMTVFIVGQGDPSPTRASIHALKIKSDVRLVPDGMIYPKDWPSNGTALIIQAGDSLLLGAAGLMSAALQDASIAYSDCEVNCNGTLQPWFKPEWDQFLFLTQGYVFGLVALDSATSTIPSDGILVTDLVTSALTSIGARIKHVPEVLVRVQSVSAFGEAPMSRDWLMSSVTQLVDKVAPGSRVTALPDAPWLRRIHWALPDARPQVSVLIPTRNHVDLLRPCIESLLGQTSYPNLDVLVIDNGSDEEETKDYLGSLSDQRIRVLSDARPFNFSALNNRAAEMATGDILCLMNNDIETLHADWLDEMVGLLMQPGTGAVGAKLLWDNDMVQHAGVILGVNGGADHVGTNWHKDDDGYFGRNRVVQSYSAVTAACLILRREDYFAVGGLDEQAFPVAFNDVDLCLKLREAGKSVIWTPHACLRHHESASRGKDQLPEKAARARRELDNLRDRWGKWLACDPAYNPNMNLDRPPFAALALPPRKLVDRQTQQRIAPPKKPFGILSSYIDAFKGAFR